MPQRHDRQPGKVRVVYLVRHAKARDRAGYVGRDSLRPLSGSGRRQAAAIALHYGDRVGYEIGEVLSSPAARCTATVAPLAEVRGLPVEERKWLAEGEDAASAFDKLVERAAAGPAAAGLVACSHGDVIWGVLDEPVDRGVSFDGPPTAPKASVWELSIIDAEVVAARFAPPP